MSDIQQQPPLAVSLRHRWPNRTFVASSPSGLKTRAHTNNKSDLFINHFNDLSNANAVSVPGGGVRASLKEIDAGLTGPAGLLELCKLGSTFTTSPPFLPPPSLVTR